MSDNSSNITVFAASKNILQAQTMTTIVWGILCVLGILTGSVQIIVTIFWKPLRKAELALIFAIAVCDWLKAAAFGVLAIRRIYETVTGTDDVGNQRNCMIWLFFVMAPMDTVYALILALSVERLLGLALPVWYNVQRIEFRLFLIAASVAVGVSTSGGLFIGASPTLMLPACAFASSPAESYRRFANAFADGMACSTLFLNLLTCVLLIGRWRKAVKAKTDMTAFKKSVRYSALKTLLVVVCTYLFSTGMSAVFIAIITSGGWDDQTKLSYAPLSACFELIRGVIDFPCYVLMVQEYRKGFKEMILKKFLR